MCRASIVLCGRRLLTRTVEVVLAARCVLAAHPHTDVHASLCLVPCVNQILVVQSWVSRGRLVVHVVTVLDLFSCASTGFTVYMCGCCMLTHYVCV